MEKFRRSIILVALVLALIAEVVSILVLGLNWDFTIGLLGGTAVSIVNFTIMTITTEMSLEKKNPFLTMISMVIRFALYGGVFALAIMQNYTMGAGCAIGFFTVQIAIFYIHAIKPSMQRTKAL